MKNCVRLLTILLCLCLLFVGCGEAETPQQEAPYTPVGKPDLKVADCYSYTENANGTYSYAVEWRGGSTLYSEMQRARPVDFTEMSEDVLMVSGQEGTGTGARWARFFHIENGTDSGLVAWYLAAKDNRVAFIDQRTGNYHVFVCDPFESHTYVGVYTLTGAIVPDGGDLVKDFAMSEDGVLTVTYVTEKGDKVIEIDMNAKAE